MRIDCGSVRIIGFSHCKLSFSDTMPPLPLRERKIIEHGSPKGHISPAVIVMERS